MKIVILYLLLSLPISLSAQQVADTTYTPAMLHPEYSTGEGPVIFIDEGHHNFHTRNGRYLPFANLLERDGYTVEAYAGTFAKTALAKGKILVISNALHESNIANWYQPNPSAFTEEEIAVIRSWVEDGGNLFLIADHMPMAGAAKDLAAAFGFTFTNGFVFDTMTGEPSRFTRKDGTLIENSITRGRNAEESVEQIVSFTGQGFMIPDDAIPILVFNEYHMNLLPDTAWVFTEKTTRLPAKGWSQGAYKIHGKGRIVVSGEAAMYTAQLSGTQQRKTGMNSEIAPENYKLLLNIIHWLDGKLE